ncbi:hypothetical protein [Sandaracinobacteroides saxicola]|uniref:Thiazole-containing bacteriocin maturation protein n=1 Tax=Sandaracinobacteroides saxicola TaxID=2759707 RepID=A0A7G5IIT9_9SPHN|nr:hypothetical protein [Sandaracinobacteroides saxicola]QMW23281.1 hypothetical protein H3309_01855 [Sandaracinobacteroides saxicola]
MASQAATVPPSGPHRLKSYVYFGLVDRGVWFEAGDRSFLLPDVRLYPLIERFVTMIDRGRPLDAILAAAPATARTVLTHVTQSLIDHDMLVPVHPQESWVSTRTGHDGLDELMKLLEDRLHGPALVDAATRWRAARVVVVGSGYALKAAAGALAASGCAELAIDWRGVSLITAAEVLRATTDRAAPDCAVVLRQQPGDAPPADGDLVLHVADTMGAKTALAIEATLRQRAVPGVIAGLFAGHACVAPPPEPDGMGVAALLHWLPPAPVGGQDHSPASLSVLGCVAAQAALHAFFGFDHQARRAHALVVSPALTCARHAVVPVVAPAWVPAQSRGAPAFVHAPRHDLPPDRPLELYETIRMALDPWFDPLLGPLSQVEDPQARQMPLMHCAIDVRASGASASTRVFGWGVDFGQAGLRALRAAVARLANPLMRPGAAIAVGWDAEACGAAARTAAFAASPLFRESAVSAWLPDEALAAPEIRLLTRLLGWIDPRPARLRLHWSPLGPARVAELWLGDAPQARSVGGGIVEAITEALGEAVSRLQLAGVPHLSGDPVEPLSAPPAADWRGALRQTPFVAEPLYRQLEELGLPPLVHCGYAQGMLR